ncbi:MAG: oligosaccharide repeat unit polymerase [Clostridia bacterium]|nr:oligosaccharide repeat unit polymerase [Clostridia bacterium]
MNNTVICKRNILFLIYTALTTIVLALGYIFSDINHYATGFLLVVVAVILYFGLVYSVADKNWLDIRAVFHAVWIFTIGLAALRLTNYQEQWQVKTWICLAIAYLMFQLGSHFGIALGEPLYNQIKSRFQNRKVWKISFEAKENRYFWICVVTTLIGLLCFSINVAIRGYIPCFSSNTNAYIEFYTKFHIFSVAATGVSGFCYYCIATQKLSKVKKVILILCILYSTFIFPTMVVSRGVFLASALALTVTAFYIHKKKFLVLVGCLAIIASIYYGTSVLRNYTDEQLDYFFEPSKIDLNIDNSTGDNNESSDLSENSTEKTFSLHPKVAFIYSYLTVSHDNFNEAVENSTEYTYGIHQFAPFNTIFRLDWADEKLEKSEYYLVRPHLNTVNLIGYFYYDLHVWGVAIFTLLWAFVFGILQKIAEISKPPFILLALGNAMIPVALSFFTAWMSVFSQWMLWGVVLIFAVASSIKINSNKK